MAGNAHRKVVRRQVAEQQFGLGVERDRDGRVLHPRAQRQRGRVQAQRPGQVLTGGRKVRVAAGVVQDPRRRVAHLQYHIENIVSVRGVASCEGPYVSD